eukprot:scaffold469_cov391-Prasinococcus_capsulatus_cf.AAC.7
MPAIAPLSVAHGNRVPAARAMSAAGGTRPPARGRCGRPPWQHQLRWLPRPQCYCCEGGHLVVRAESVCR